MAQWIRRRERDPETKKVTPGILECPNCHAPVYITYDGVECEKCGQMFNLFGQRITHRGY